MAYTAGATRLVSERKPRAWRLTVEFAVPLVRKCRAEMLGRERPKRLLGKLYPPRPAR